MVVVKDQYGNIFQTTKNDERFKNGELTSIVKNTVVVKDNEGKCFRISTDDPRYLNGELKSCITGTKVNHPLRKCPHCGIEGKGANMTRYHFNNCKLNIK